MKRTHIFVILNLALAILPAMPAGGQTIYNLDTIWQKQQPAYLDTVENFGTAITGGDLNGDGYSDIAVTSRANYTGTFTGRIYIYTDIVDTTADFVIFGEKIATAYGQTICTGDYNSDGYDDIVVGAPDYGSTYEDGKVYVYYGGDPMDTVADWSVTRVGSREYFGSALSSGDINGDGIDDLVVGALGSIVNNWLDGRVYIYYGDTLGLHTWPDVVINGGYYDTQEQMGRNVTSGMDLNGDGFDDVVIGAAENCVSYFLAGRVYIYFGGNPMDTLPDGWVNGEGVDHDLGAYKMGWCGNKKNGYIGFSTFWYPGGYGSSQANGKVYLLKMDEPWDTIPDITKIGDDTITALGWQCATLGMLGTDTLVELGVSLVNPIGPPYGLGQSEVWLGRNEMTTSTAGYIRGRWQWDRIVNMAGAGDVDGDGSGEVLFSNPQADTNRCVWLCKYTGPDGVAGTSVSSDKVYSLKLGQNYPNPFKQSTVIRYQVTGDGPVKLAVYNIAGQLVKTLTPPNPPPSFQNGESFSGQALEGRDKREGSGSITWDGRDDNGRAVANGVYIYRLNAGGKSISKKMIIIK